MEEDLEALSMNHSFERFKDNSGEENADNALLFADGLLYMVATFSLYLVALDIWGGNLNPLDWEWGRVDFHLLFAAFGLWVVSQSLNDFKRLLPLWLKLMLKMEVGPTGYGDQSPSARKRRAFSLMIAGPLCWLVAWRLSISTEQLVTRVNVPFHYVVAVLGILLILISIHWFRLIQQPEKIIDRTRFNYP